MTPSDAMNRGKRMRSKGAWSKTVVVLRIPVATQSRPTFGANRERPTLSNIRSQIKDTNDWFCNCPNETLSNTGKEAESTALLSALQGLGLNADELTDFTASENIQQAPEHH